ncbi:MAG: metallophosphoesterase [Candidatus Pacearchaeota archaeon]|jgi:hypothetical protein
MKPPKIDKNTKDYEFIEKAVFFPKEKILAIGDMHLGYEIMLKENGSLLPQTQIEQTKEDLKKIFDILHERKIKLNKIVFLGDIKHFFSFHKYEKNVFLDIIFFLEKYISRENIILIKGNHEKMMALGGKEFVDYYIQGEIAFVHGDIMFKELLDKNIKKIVMGHLHPAVTIMDKQRIRSEKYKCFLIGEYKNKQVFILPSFFPLIEGTSINEYLGDGSCMIPQKNLYNFEVFAIGEGNKIYDFGKLKGIRKKFEY